MTGNMIAFIKRILRDRRAATAVAMAILAVPLIISASAAVDFARIASARALLQASTDAAAIAGAGAWQTSESSSSASSVATAAYAGTAAQLANFVTTTAQAPLLTCTGSSTQCGGSTSFATSTSTYGCPSSAEYCVIVQATGVLKNSLFAWLVPSETLSVKSIATTAFPATTITNDDFSNTSVGYGSSYSGMYAYVVPKNTNGDGGHNYSSLPTPNTNCASASNGPISLNSTFTTPASGVTQCNYLLIGENASGGTTGGSLTVTNTDPIAFTLVNDLDGRTPGGLDNTSSAFTSDSQQTTLSSSQKFYTEIYYNGTYSAAPYSVPASTPSNLTCQNQNGTTKCKLTSGTTATTSSATPLYGYCPLHSLYGSITTYMVNGTNIVPVSDSLATYSSAYEMLGYSPSHGANTLLRPFLGPTNSITVNKITYTSKSYTSGTTSSTTYNVQVVCPQWTTTPGTNISATGDYSFTPSGSSSSDIETVNVYSTYYPDTTYSDGISGHVFPPAISGCAPVTSATTATPNASATNQWWGWSPSNLTSLDPSDGNSYTNCTSRTLNTSNTGITVTKSYQQSSSYSNCALLIQPLGSNVPLSSSGASALPDYYIYTVDPNAFAAHTTGNPDGITAMIPIWDELTTGTPISYIEPKPPEVPASDAYITFTVGTASNGIGVGNIKITDSHAPGYTPSGSGIPSVTANGDGTYNVIELPSVGGTATDHYPPYSTAHQCYNPKANNFSSGTYVGDSNDGTPIDPVANPQLGVVYCGQSKPPSYGIYWNNMGGHNSDDLGYGNAITVFTCPTPSTTSGGGPATLSG
jgi:Flp pilus assembly protein TadG